MSAVKWMEIFESEIGQKEVPGPGNNSRILEYLKVCDKLPDNLKRLDSTHWCAAFVSWVFEQAGIKSLRNAWAEAYLNWGVPCKPKFGCVVVLKNHVAFYLASDDNWIWLGGGNQNDSVCVKAYSKKSVLGYRWPA